MLILHVTWWLCAAALLGGAAYLVWSQSRAEEKKAGRSRGTMALLLLFVLFGMVRGDMDRKSWQARDAVVESCDGTVTRESGTVAAMEHSDGEFTVTVKNGSPIPCVLVSIEEGKLREPLRIGMKVMAAGRVKEFTRARNPGEFDSLTYYHGLGTDCRLYGEELKILDSRSYPLPDLLYRLREHGKKIIMKAAREKDAGVYRAAVLGDKKGLDQELKELYQVSGIAHLLAISGLHLSMIGLGIYGFLRKTGLGYGASGAAGGCFILLYGYLTGSPPSVVRAVIMMLVSFWASYLGRTYDMLSAASLALFFLGLQSPKLVLSGGVLLSFGAVFAIAGAAPVLVRWIGSDVRFANTAAVSIGVQLVTLPITAICFFKYPLYGIFLNLLVIPLMGGVVCSGIGVIVLGSVTLTAGVCAAGAGHYILQFYEWLCLLAARLPLHSVCLGKPGMGTVVCYYAVLIGSLAGMKRLAERCSEDPRKDIPFKYRLFFLAVLCIFCFSILLPRPVKGLDAVFLDVGQGDGCLIRTGRASILIDGGSTSEKSLGEYRLEPCIRSYGIDKIDDIFVSHGDKDHISGIGYLLESCGEPAVGRLLLPYQGQEDEALLKLKALADEREIPVVWLKAGDVIREEGLTITCLYPGTDDAASDTNEESEVLKLDYGDCHMLFTGDMSGDGEERLLNRLEEAGEERVLREIQVLKTAHHGSKYSSRQEFLDALGVRFAVISYGEGNSYGHPHKEVVERMEERKITILKTAESGAVMMHTDGKRVRWEAYAE